MSAVLRKELYIYFSTPLAYILAAAFLLGNGYLFSVAILSGQPGILGLTFQDIAVLSLLVTPLLTMRLLAEEGARGTVELLLTTPVSEIGVVLGKFLACLALVGGLLALTVLYPLILLVFGGVDPGQVLGGYVGLFLLATVSVAVGVFVSSLTDSQVVAGVFSFVVLLLLWFLQPISLAVGPPVGAFLAALGLSTHLTALSQGLWTLSDTAFFLSMAAAFLFFAVLSLESRRWR
ncbi:MAG: ABC transporter permease subunit [Thermaerobacter sp.]|nr:ABC transporter permease subunit [Thermaerobacter sp.]